MTIVLPQVDERRRSEVAAVLIPALGGEDAARMTTALALASGDSAFMVLDGEDVAAAVAGRHRGDAWVIDAIGVLESRRGEGLARGIVEALTQRMPAGVIQAETDSEGAGFYARAGFEVVSLGEKYPGVERFRVRRHIDDARLPDVPERS